VLVAAAVLGGVAFDALLAEPPARLHPVALFGRLAAVLEGRSAAAGLAGAAVLPLGFGLAAALVVVATRTAVGPGLGGPAAAGAAALVLFATTSRRMLVAEARAVARASDADPGAARRRLRALAGRDADALSPGQLRSAAVESAAENLSDGLVAPLVGALAGCVLGGAVGAPLAGAAAGAAWVKGVNTLDSMFGYPDRAVGTAPARLDDLVMWLPARLSAGLLGLAALAPGAPLAARTDARTPASPNAGWPMATLAAALGVRLAKPGHYGLGGPALPTPVEADRGVRIVDRAAVLAAVLAAGVGVIAC
jgi:adenosylcobinamide-phosphate synthase